MTSVSTDTRASQGMATRLLAIAIPCWFIFAYVHLYFFGYAAMDSWCYAGPAATARVPFAITTPFLGSFEGADKAWGLHWPGGPLLTSIITPFLPHNPATYVAIYLCYWLMLALAVAALVRRLTSSQWLALCAFLFVASDRISFGVTWLERYELLGSAIAITAVLALCGRQDRHASVRSAIIGIAFFVFPLLHPVFSGLGLAWLAYLGFRTFALRLPWKHFCIAAAGYAAGWAAFLGYFWSRPWLYAEFISHAHVNVELTRTTAPPGIRTFLRHLFLETDAPTREGVAIYLAALGGALFLLCLFWKSRREWREFLSREDLGIFAALGLLCTLFLAQFTYNGYYWATAWPFAVAVSCQVTHRLMQEFPGRRRIVAGALAALLFLHGGYFAGRTYLWHKTGFVNLRVHLREFASSLPQTGQLFVPEVLWDTYAGGNRKVFMDTLPYLAGDPAEKRYASYIASLMRSGDVLVIDLLQSHIPLIDPHGPGWKEIGHCNVVYKGESNKVRGYELTAYQKQ